MITRCNLSAMVLWKAASQHQLHLALNLLLMDLKLLLTHIGASYQLPKPSASTPSTPAAPSIAQRQWITSLSVKR